MSAVAKRLTRKPSATLSRSPRRLTPEVEIPSAPADRPLKRASHANPEGLALALFSARPEKDRFPDKSKTQQNSRLSVWKIRLTIRNDPSDNSK
jgi:hypothetical protein